VQIKPKLNAHLTLRARAKGREESRARRGQERLDVAESRERAKNVRSSRSQTQTSNKSVRLVATSRALSHTVSLSPSDSKRGADEESPESQHAILPLNRRIEAAYLITLVTWAWSPTRLCARVVLARAMRTESAALVPAPMNVSTAERAQG